MALKNETRSAFTTKAFYEEYVTGMSSRQLGKEFQSDSKRLKQLYFDAVQEINPETPADEIPLYQRTLSVLSALTKRLNPVRRLVFGVAIVSFFLHYIFILVGLSGYILHPLLLPLAFSGILVILLLSFLKNPMYKKSSILHGRFS
jgi:hypothetical protein